MGKLPYIVAVTGGVASGKSTVCDRLAAHDVTVIDADRVARELVEPGEPALAEIAARFGPSILTAEGRLDRRAMRERVFASDGARKALEAILHPRVRERMRAHVERVSPNAPYVVLAIPLLAEVGRYPWIDRVIVVDAARATQLARLVARDGVTPALAEAMLAAQVSREARLAVADEVVANDGTLADLLARTDALHAALMDRALESRAP